MSYLNNIPYLENFDFSKEGKLKVKMAKPVVIMIQGNYCGYCTQMKPEYLKFARQMKDKLFCATIQIDGSPSEKKLGQRLRSFIPNFRGVPMIVAFKDGKYYKTHTGPRTTAALIEFSNSL